MNREIVVVISNFNKNCNFIQTVEAVKNAGFKNVFIQWYNENWIPSQEEQLKYIRDKGLNVLFAHLGYQNINDLWIDDKKKGDLLVERYKNDISICKKNDIPMVIMHLTSKHRAPKYNEIGLRRIREIVDYAQLLGIDVAFENNKIEGYLEYVIDNINNDNVGICFDAGHYHAHFDDKFSFEKFKNRIFAVHFHDNDKSGDQHLIPFDGTLDWKNVINNLKLCNYRGPITLELYYQGSYLDLGLDEFYKKGYDAGIKLRNFFDNDD